MSSSYKIHNFVTAKSLNLPYYYDWDEEAGDDYEFSYRCGIWLYEDDVAVELVGTDGGEPEDQSLTRNWSWVVDELNKAYQRGVQDGSNAV